MDPKEFGWGESQQVTVTNPLSEDHVFQVHSKEYAVGAGETVKMPGFIAWVCVYTLASKIAHQEGTFYKWNEEGYRVTLYERITNHVDNVLTTVQSAPKAETFEAAEEPQKAPEAAKAPTVPTVPAKKKR